jgi:hypothetical protein
MYLPWEMEGVFMMQFLDGSVSYKDVFLPFLRPTTASSDCLPCPYLGKPQPGDQIQASTCFINKVLVNHTHAHPFHTIYGCLHSTTGLHSSQLLENNCVLGKQNAFFISTYFQICTG